MYLLCKYVRQAGAAPLPEPSQPSDPATRWAGDLRGRYAPCLSRPGGRPKPLLPLRSYAGQIKATYPA